MSHNIVRSFEYDGAPAAGYSLLIGAYVGMASAQNSDIFYRGLGGGEGVTNGPIPIPASGIVAIEVMTDDPVTLTLVDPAGAVAYTEVVGKASAVDADVAVAPLSGTAIVDFFVTPGAISVAATEEVEFTITEVLADGTTRPSVTPTVTSNATGTATETELDGVVTVTGVAAGATTIDVEVTLGNGEVKEISVPVTVTA